MRRKGRCRCRKGRRYSEVRELVAVVSEVRVRWSCLRVEVLAKAKRRYRHHLLHLHHLHHHHHHLHHHPLSRSEAVMATAILRRWVAYRVDIGARHHAARHEEVDVNAVCRRTTARKARP